MCADEDELKVNNGEDELKVNIVEEEFGQRKVKKIQDPKAPTKEEREEHEKPICLFGAGASTASDEGSNYRTAKGLRRR